MHTLKQQLIADHWHLSSHSFPPALQVRQKRAELQRSQFCRKCKEHSYEYSLWCR